MNSRLLAAGEDLDVTDLAYSLDDLEKRIAALESLWAEHLRTSRQACMQEVGFLEQHLSIEPTTAELRDMIRKKRGG